MTVQTYKLQEILRDHDYSVTRQRTLVFSALADQEPISMYELYERIAGQLDRASVYRTVALFESLGIVRRINIGWKYKIELSDTFAEHHHHLTCLDCHKVIPISETELEGFIADVAAHHNFLPADHQVEIQGYCIACRSKR